MALLAVMEAPAILTGLWLARRGTRGAQPKESQVSLASTVVREVLLHGSVVLLLGSFAIGWLTGSKGLEELGPVFVQPFKGVLCVFLLDMGLVVARRLSDLRAVSLGVAAFGFYMPLIGATAGMGAALFLGLSVGGATLLAVLGASASYIVVPAVMRVAVPEASPAIYLTLALGITFPFNLVVGIPLYQGVARALASASSTEESARILEVNLGAITREVWAERPDLRERVGREWTHEHYQNHRRDRAERFLKEKIEILEKLMAAGGHTHLILAGSPRMTARIQNCLPKHLQAKLIDVVPAPANARGADVVAATLSSFIERVQQESLDAVAELGSALRRGGLGAAGTVATLDALRRGQADVLVMARAYEPGPTPDAWEEAVDLGGS